MDKLPEYLRETVDWFMGKTRRKGDRGECCTDAEQKLYLQEPLLECRIQEPDLIFLTDLPGGLDYNEWMASHTIGFFEHINLIYGTVSEYCTQTSCPEMSGPGSRIYFWMDEKGKKLRLSAPQYIDYIMTYCQKTINEESIFPTKHGNEFPAGFEQQHIRKMFRLMLHVLAHIYHAHFREIVLLQLHAHVNALFAHFVGFSVRFNLLDEKEMEAMSDLIVALKILPANEDHVDSSSMGQQQRGQSTSDTNSGEADHQAVGETGGHDTVNVVLGEDSKETNSEVGLDGVVITSEQIPSHSKQPGAAPAEPGSNTIAKSRAGYFSGSTIDGRGDAVCDKKD